MPQVANSSNRDAILPYIPPRRQPVKLRYLPQHRVLVCVQCGYCVLPRALDRHLKVLHHLPAAERKPHLEGVQDLNLGDLEDVVYPEAESEPVPGLPVYDGYACGMDGCKYLSVTNKRMQAHWRTEHSGSTDHCCRPVRLQTFFRGNSLRYFTVARPTPVESDSNLQFSSLQRSAPPVSEYRIHFDNVTGFSKPYDRMVIDTHGSEIAQRFQNLTTTHNEARMILQPQAQDSNIATSMEWLLTNQFCVESFVRVQPVVSSAPTWRDEMLQACFEADFLRFAVLSLTANFVAYTYPDSREKYGQEAHKYRELAIVSLANEVSEVTSKNFFAIFNFTRLMTLCCLAGVQLNRLQGVQPPSAALNMLPEWFQVQLEGKKLTWPFKGNGRLISAMHSPWKPMAASNAMLDYDLDSNPFDEKLADLEFTMKSLPTELVDASCLQALNILRRVWATPYRDGGNAFRDVALMWAVRIPPRFLSLVEAHDSAALVVMAHYWVLWSQSEGFYWYMKGHAETMLTRIVERLGQQWQILIEWPVSMVLGPDSIGTSF